LNVGLFLVGLADCSSIRQSGFDGRQAFWHSAGHYHRQRAFFLYLCHFNGWKQLRVDAVGRSNFKKALSELQREFRNAKMFAPVSVCVAAPVD